MNIKLIIYRNSDLYRMHNVKSVNALSNNQIDSSNLSVKYNNNTYIFEKSIVDENHYILISKNNDECVSVVISKDGFAEIHEIENNSSCLQDTNQNVGSFLFVVTIKMLIKYKNEFNIKMLILSDNRLKKCGEHNIILSQMLTLLTDDTWYIKYGFRPIIYENNTYKIDEIANKKYEKNKMIMNKIKIRDVYLIKYINETNNDKIIKATIQIIKNYPNMLLKDYLSNLLNEYDKTCIYFYQFYRKLFDDIGLTNFHRQQFGLILT